MKVLHCIASMDKNAGGTTTAVLDILGEQSNHFDVELYTLNSKNQIDISKNNLELFSEEYSYLGYSKALEDKIYKSDADLFHGHALWGLSIHQMVKVARNKGKPYIISIHGMLHEWSLKQSKIKKKIAFVLYQNNDLKKAQCLHGTSYDEADFIRKQGYKNPIAVIPNGISINDFPQKNKSNSPKKKRKILFLSRVHSQKGIELLLDSWAMLNEDYREKWVLDIAGMGEDKFINYLKLKCSELKILSSVIFSGAVYGEEKIAKYHSADLFILPSYTENFGMVIGEALSCGIPVITTKGTPWRDLEAYNAGAWIDLSVDSIKKSMEEFLAKDYIELEQMGTNGRKLVEEKYSIESVGKMFVELYQWMLKKADKPKFVV